MKQKLLELLPRFREILGLDEDPMGIFYTDQKPAEGFTPSPLDLPTREKEKNDEIDWQAVFGQFSCVLGNIWRARKKQTAAFLKTKTWPTVQKKIARSKKAWGEA